MVGFVVSERNSLGKKDSCKLRDMGKVPGVVYSSKGEVKHISFDRVNFVKLYNAGAFKAKVIDISLGGDSRRIVLQAIQVDPITDKLIHADFKFVEEGQKVKLKVPVNLLGRLECKGVKKGGKLNMPYRELTIECDPNNVPNSIDIDISKLDIGDKVRFSTLPLEDGIKFICRDMNASIVNITGRKRREDSSSEEEGESN